MKYDSQQALLTSMSCKYVGCVCIIVFFLPHFMADNLLSNFHSYVVFLILYIGIGIFFSYIFRSLLLTLLYTTVIICFRTFTLVYLRYIGCRYLFTPTLCSLLILYCYFVILDNQTYIPPSISSSYFIDRM